MEFKYFINYSKNKKTFIINSKIKQALIVSIKRHYSFIAPPSTLPIQRSQSLPSLTTSRYP